MSNRQKSGKQSKTVVECGLRDKCARGNCTFKHHSSRNLEANIRREQHDKRENVIRLEKEQTEQLMQQCRNGDECAQLSCPFRHPPHWNPVHNQQIIQSRRQHEEQRREKQRQHAQSVCHEVVMDRPRGLDRHRLASCSKSFEDDEYQYDDEYFDVHKKVWQKQTERQLGKW